MTLDVEPERLPAPTSTVRDVASSDARGQESLVGLLRQPELEDVASLFRQFIAAAGNGHGGQGIARVLQQHTGKPVIVEDPAGQIIASSGVDELDPAIGNPQRRSLPESAVHAVANFDVDRWVAVASPRGEVLGAISLLDAGGQATGLDLFELEQAASILGWDLLHSRDVAEAEVALWGDFATELLESSDADRVRSHAARLGYDLDQPYRALLVSPSGEAPLDLRDVVTRATARLGVKGLATDRPNGVAVIVAEELSWAELANAVNSECEGRLSIGVGGRYRLQEITRSLADAEFALALTRSTREKPVAVFDDLGVWRLLARPDASDLNELVDHWIGPLIDYDREHRSELLKTLIAYLNEFGALEATAAKLYVHRNSLRYRLLRINELTGWDLNDPEQRFHLDLACRAWLVRQALESPSETVSSLETNSNGVAKGSRLLTRRASAARVAFAGKGTKTKPRQAGLI
jgi:hypothetical protein